MVCPPTPAARSLHVSAPEPGGAVVLDFNRASNLPCAFTDYATCPVAPRREPPGVRGGSRREDTGHPLRKRTEVSAPLSVLDLSPISEGGTARLALRNSLDLARSAEAWGYKRYWVAEHHFVGVASSSPAVLVGLIAAATNTIRVGSAAVLLGNNTAAQVVEAFVPSKRCIRVVSISVSGAADSVGWRHFARSLPERLRRQNRSERTSYATAS